MGRHRKVKDVSALPPVCQRFHSLLHNIWHGSALRMAHDVGVSYPAILRVLKGQLPSGKVLVSLAQRNDVDIAWLLKESKPPWSIEECGVS